MIRSSDTLNRISGIFCEATKDVISSSTGKDVTYANTIQKIPSIHLRPEIGCFVLFSGDYSGLMIMNFSSESAVTIYREYMLNMGLPEEELAKEHTADDVVDSIGEMINQIIGKVRSEVEKQYGLVATNTQPKAIALTTSIVLTIDAQEVDKELCRRLSFKIDGQSFHIEISLEKTEFISMEGDSTHNSDKMHTNEAGKMLQAGTTGKKTMSAKKNKAGNKDIDFEALLKDHQ
jgi:chemotaxis protein CheY-P-specific phosphatase CheC